MNQEMLTSLVRTILQTAGASLVTHGWVDKASWTEIASGLAVVIVTTGWSLYTRTNSSIVASAASQDGVAKIVLKDPAAAAASASSKVVAG